MLPETAARKWQVSASAPGLAACKKDETDARNELDTRWRKFGASDKQACIVESSTGGDQSYVELLTCLEMSTGQFDDSGRQMGN